MSSVTGQSDILEVDDKTTSALFISLIFIIGTASLLGFVANNTEIFSSDAFSAVLQIILFLGFLFILAVAANYKGLDLIQDHAYTIIKWCYLAGFAVTVLLLAGTGLLLIISGSFFGIILLIIGVGLGLLFMKIWSWLHERIKRAAEWLKIGATIVLNEPGMILLSFIQSIVIGIAAIVELVSITAWLNYAETTGVEAGTSDLVAYLIMFLYLWLSLAIIYYYDGANTIIAYSRIHGYDPKVGQGLNAAGKKIIAISIYAIISALVTVFVQFLHRLAREQGSEGRTGAAIVLSIVGSIAQYVYYLVSFFTLPAIVIRQQGAISGMKESYNLFKKTFWDIIIADTGYSYGAAIMYVFTGIILAVFGFGYGYFVSTTLFGVGSGIFAGIIVAIIALIFGLLVSKFFLKPLYTALVTTMYTYATEGPESLKIVPNELKGYLQEKSQSPKVMRQTY